MGCRKPQATNIGVATVCEVLRASLGSIMPECEEKLGLEPVKTQAAQLEPPQPPQNQRHTATNYYTSTLRTAQYRNLSPEGDEIAAIDWGGARSHIR